MSELSKDEVKFFKEYISAGFFILPLNSQEKKPAILDMLNKASNSLAQLLEWKRTLGTDTWGISMAKSGLWALDIDLAHKGLAQWKMLAAAHGEPDTLKQVTGSGGLHYVFRYEEGLELKGLVKPGMDIKYNGYIVVTPSVNHGSKPYTWEGGFDPQKIKPLKDEWLLKLVSRKEKTKGKTRKTFSPNAQKSIVSQAAELLSEVQLPYADWVAAGMAIHSYNSEQEGKDLWLKLSNGAGFVEGDEKKAVEKWESFSATGGVGIGSLFHFVYEYCGQTLNPTFENDDIVFVAGAKGLTEKLINPSFYMDASGSLVNWHRDDLVETLNKEYALIGGNHIARVTLRDDNTKELSTLNTEAFKLGLKDKFFAFWDNDAAERKLAPASEVWLKSYKRRSYKRVVFLDPKESSENELNLWSELPCKAIEGDASLFRKFILEHVCNDSAAHYEFIMNWLASGVQNPEIKSPLVPVVVGVEGTGKGLFTDYILKGIYGGFYHKISTTERLKARFNMEQMGKFITVLDEATWGGSKIDQNFLKSEIGSPSKTYEEKFGASIDMRTYTNYIMTSNEALAAAVPQDNRRFQFFEMKKLPAGKSAVVLKPYWDQINNNPDFIGIIYNDLLKRDIESYNPFILPENLSGGDFSKVHTGGVVSRFFHDLIFETPYQVFYKGGLLNKTELYNNLQAFVKESNSHERNVTKNSLSRKIKDIFGDLDVVKRKVAGFETCELFYVITPTQFKDQFCKSLNILPPNSFDATEYFNLEDTEF